MTEGDEKSNTRARLMAERMERREDIDAEFAELQLEDLRARVGVVRDEARAYHDRHMAHMASCETHNQLMRSILNLQVEAQNRLAAAWERIATVMEKERESNNVR